MAKKRKPRKIPEVLVFTDTNNYPDALASLVVLSWMADQNLISLKGIVTELGVFDIRRRRASYAKGAMLHLGYPFLRVVPGGDYVVGDEETENNFPDTEIGREIESMGTAVGRSGMTFIQEYIKAATEKNVYLLLCAPFPDLAKYIEATSKALSKKVKKIIIMGGAAEEKDENGNYLPDYNCFNFKIGQPAADILFKYAQEYGTRLVLVPSQTVKDMNMGYEFLDAVANSKNPVARQLLADRGDNPVSMQYDMVAALVAGDGGFKRAGGTIEQEEGSEKNVYFANVADPELMKQTFCEIFKQKLLPKKITLDQLRRKTPEEEENNG